MACTALIRPARSASSSAVRPASPSMDSGTATSTHTGMASAPTPYTCAVWPSRGTDSRLPATTPATQPRNAGTATWMTYEATTWPGEKPMDFSTPIRRVPATTAPLTTLATISTDITSPISPNATMNGTQGAIEPVSCSLTVSQDCAPIRAPCGSAACSAAMSAVTSAVVPALAKRYSICATSGVPGARSAAISAGATQAWAVLVIDVALPTTVRRVPMPIPAPWPSLCSTTCPGCVAQWPEISVRSSTGPPGDGRPTTVICCCVWRGGPDWPGGGGRSMVAVTVVWGNGPAAAVTPARWVVAASWAGEAWVAAVTSEPCRAANAWSNGALESTGGPSASVAAAAERSTTRPITMNCTRRPDSAPG